VAAIAARKAGARTVTANDIDPVALAIARQNGAQNRVSLHFDCENRIETGSVGQAQLILCSDFFYAKVESLALRVCWPDGGRSITILIGRGGAFVPADYRSPAGGMGGCGSDLEEGRGGQDEVLARKPDRLVMNQTFVNVDRAVLFLYGSF
jgi:hypothetical protein